MAKKLDIKLGIFQTEYTLICHRDGTRTVRAPYLDWSGIGGSISHRKIKISTDHAAFVDACFDQGDRESAFDLDQRLQLIQMRR